jgi:hypothetical protein
MQIAWVSSKGIGNFGANITGCAKPSKSDPQRCLSVDDEILLFDPSADNMRLISEISQFDVKIDNTY